MGTRTYSRTYLWRDTKELEEKKRNKAKEEEKKQQQQQTKIKQQKKKARPKKDNNKKKDNIKKKNNLRPGIDTVETKTYYDCIHIHHAGEEDNKVDGINPA